MAGGAARLLLAALLVVPVAAQRELRFKPPAEAPVRLFTEPELARYDGQQVGAGGRPSRGGASGLRASPAFSLKPRGRAGAGGPGGARRRAERGSRRRSLPLASEGGRALLPSLQPGALKPP